MRLSERAARRALLALCLLAPAVYLPRVLLGRQTPEPASLPPAWMHLVVVTVADAGALADATRGLEREDAGATPALAAFDRRAARVAGLWAAAPSGAGAAASFWTGRYPSSHGVTGPDRALGPGVWTLARGARGAGARTAAFLQEPLCSATVIQGFDEVVEDAADAGGLIEAAGSFLERTARPAGGGGPPHGERALVWLHLVDADAARLDAALARIERALLATDRAPETALALFALRTGPPRPDPSGAPAPPGAALRVVLPGALSAARRSDALLSQVDLCGLLARLAGLRAPADAPLAARVELAWSALNGASPEPGVLYEGEETLWQRGALRARLGGVEERLTPGGAQPLEAAEAAALRDEARRVVPSFARPETATRDAEVPAGAWPAEWRG